MAEHVIGFHGVGPSFLEKRGKARRREQLYVFWIIVLFRRHRGNDKPPRDAYSLRREGARIVLVFKNFEYGGDVKRGIGEGQPHAIGVHGGKAFDAAAPYRSEMRITLRIAFDGGHGERGEDIQQWPKENAAPGAMWRCA
jgi:hypothetical protein